MLKSEQAETGLSEIISLNILKSKLFKIDNLEHSHANDNKD